MIYEADAYRAALVECTRRIEAESGVRFPADGIEIKESCDKAGRVTFSTKISYRGPLMMKTGTPPRIKIDLTQHELIVDDPDSRPIRHFYPDALKPAVAIRCYSANEILAEKTRALFERQDRARDLYDVVNILRCYREHIDARRASAILKAKFAFKSLPAPSVGGIIAKIDFGAIQANWAPQLKHQLPVLPPVESYFDDLRETALLWVEGVHAVQRDVPIPPNQEEESIPPVAFPQLQQEELAPRVPLSHGVDSAFGRLELIHYAARNRLCVEICSYGVIHLVEPYALRMPRSGNPLLYVQELLGEGVPVERMKTFRVSEIQTVRVTEKSFRPRYRVEL